MAKANGENSGAELSVLEQVARTAREAGDDFNADTLTLMMRLYRAVAAVDRTHASELAPYKLNLSQFQVLSVLHRADAPMTMRGLGESVSIRPANLTGLIDTLAQRSLVERRLNESDRRSFLVAITSTGERFLSEFLPGHWHYLQTLTAGLSMDEQRQLADLLDRLRLSVEAAPPRDTDPADVVHAK